MLHFETTEFTVKVMHVARQHGTQDSALFAIAFMTSLAHGEEPTEKKYKQEMRAHLVTYFGKNEMSTFPALIRKKKSQAKN